MTAVCLPVLPEPLACNLLFLYVSVSAARADCATSPGFQEREPSQNSDCATNLPRPTNHQVVPAKTFYG